MLCALAAYGPIAYLQASYALVLAIPLGVAVYLVGTRILGVLEPGDIDMLRRAVRGMPGFTEDRAAAVVRWVGGGA